VSSCCFDLIPQIAGPVPVMVEGGPLTVSYTFCLVPCINSAAAEAVSLKCPFSDSWSSARAYLLCDTKLFEDLLSYFFFPVNLFLPCNTAAFRLWRLQKELLRKEEVRLLEARALLEKKQLRNVFWLWRSRCLEMEQILALTTRIQRNLVSR